MQHPLNNLLYPDWATSYLKLAWELVERNTPMTAVSQATASLPMLNRERLDQMDDLVEEAGFSNPYYGWAVATVTDNRVGQVEDAPLLRGRAAWLLARAANKWARPDLAAEALDRAAAIFTDLDQSAWLAACTWQRNALPWTRPNFPQAAAELAQAVTQLKGTELENLMPHCQLSLAYAQLLTGDGEAALVSVEESEKIFQTRGDMLNQARCWLTRSSALRRQDNFSESQKYLRQALELFQQLPAPLDEAKTRYQLAHLDLAARNDYNAAEQNLHLARDTFAGYDLPLWVAQCNLALGQVYLENGRIADAGQLLKQAAQVLADLNISGAQGDALFDSAKYARLVSDHAAAVHHLQQAEKLYKQVGASFMAVLAAMHLGSTYREWGFHQLALHHLERAQQQLVKMENPGRLAECHMRLAHVWLQINQPDEANACLELALNYYEQAQRPAYLATVYSRQAEVAMLTENSEQAIHYLEKAARLAEENELRPQMASAQRLLGECLCASGDVSTGLDYLQQAAADFSEMGLVFDHASCLVALGNGLIQLGQTDSAGKAWQDALNLNHETVSAVTWRARAGLARLAESARNDKEALAQYRLAMRALNRQRRDFWQPDLAGKFLQKESALVDRAVACAFNNGSDEDVLQFIEAGKAQTVARRLLRSLDTTRYKTVPEALTTAALEIQSLYEKLNARHEKSTTFYDTVADELRGRLNQKMEAYRTFRSQWERQHIQDIDLPSEDQLDIGRFCQAAEKRLAGTWMALSYYLTEDYLYVVTLIDGFCRVSKRPITPNVWVALESCIRARASRSKPTAKELAALGQWLIPDEVTEKLTPDTTLLLVPHRELHQVPWAALLIGAEQHPLVTTSIPVVVPALFCLSLLWRRETAPPPRANGLLVGASEFPGRHKRPLPQVNKEMSRIAVHLEDRGRVLIGEDATWNNVRALAGQDGLARFSFCHIAGHASFDSLTGRLSGISFYDRDVWLDEMWECAPWPQLLTMAACNGSQSLVHEGDEHVGLTTTFLSAGANTVAGSIWPVRDEDAANLLTSFYDHYIDGIQPSKALALVQREAVRQGQRISRWGSFISIGQP